MLGTILKILIPFALIMQIVPVLIWLERKGAAYIQDRRGPNRAHIAGIRLGGLVHSLADVVKLIFKEDILPTQANRIVYTLAPFVSMAVACMTFVVIPWAAPLDINGEVWNFQALNISSGLLVLFALASLGVYGTMMAGWGSNNKYSLLGGLRASAQMISYEITLSLSVLGVLIFAGSLELGAIVANQGDRLWTWNFFRQPLACLLFIVAAFAETNRNPFDLAEAEAELVAGYHTEYSSLRFALFFMAEYVNIIVASALMATLFFGGWQVPFVATETLRAHAPALMHYGLLAVGILFILLGWYLVRRKNRYLFGDHRDYEGKILGLPAFLAGIVLVVWQVNGGIPLLSDTEAQIVSSVTQFSVFLTKILFFCWVFIWVRWTLPRFRYDQLMSLGWKVMLPLAMANLLITAGLYLIF
jgi:NADH-quinone oxidoreductase subunit H